MSRLGEHHGSPASRGGSVLSPATDGGASPVPRDRYHAARQASINVPQGCVAVALLCWLQGPSPPSPPWHILH